MGHLVVLVDVGAVQDAVTLLVREATLRPASGAATTVATVGVSVGNFVGGSVGGAFIVTSAAVGVADFQLVDGDGVVAAAEDVGVSGAGHVAGVAGQRSGVDVRWERVAAVAF